MLRKSLASLVIATAALTGVSATSAHAAGKGRCLAAPERKAAITARMAAIQANITALTAAKAQAVGRPKVLARLDARLARASVNLVAEQGHLATFGARCP